MLAAITVAAFVLPHALAQQANYDGILYASSFDTWSVPPGNNGPYAWSNPSACTVTSGGLTFPAFTVGTPILISDANPAHSEVVTPTKVTVTGSGCSITVNPAYSHTSFVLESATGGLQEAVDYSIRQNVPAVVAVTPQFDGTTSTITSAIGNTNVSILDARDANMCAYDWNGSAYAKSGCFGAASSGVTSLNSLTGALNIAAGTGLSVGASGSTITLSNTAAASCTTDQLVYFSTTGITPTCLTLGTNLSITGGTLNAAGGTSGITSVNSQTGPAITLESSDSSISVTQPSTNTIDLTTVAGSGGIPNNPAATTYLISGSSAFLDDLGVLRPAATTITGTSSTTTTTTITVASTSGFLLGGFLQVVDSGSEPAFDVNCFTLVASKDQNIGYPYGCGTYKITGLTSTTLTVENRSGTASSCSSSCGQIVPMQGYLGPTMQNEPFITGHGTVNWLGCATGGSGYTLQVIDSTFSTCFQDYPNGTTAAPIYLIIPAWTDDISFGYSATQIEGYITDIAEKAHAKNWKFIIATTTGVKGEAESYQINTWIRDFLPTFQTTAGNYQDVEFDIGQNLDGYDNYMAGTGSFEPAGVVKWANALNTVAGLNQPLIDGSAGGKFTTTTTADLVLPQYGRTFYTPSGTQIMKVGYGAAQVSLPYLGYGSVDTATCLENYTDGALNTHIASTGSPCVTYSQTTNSFTAPHFIGSGTPTIAAGAGAGTSAPIAISGNDVDGYVQVQTGTSPAASSPIVTVTMANACPVGITPTLQPANAVTAALYGAGQVFAFGDSASAWEIDSNTTALPAGTYKWGYHAGCSNGEALLPATQLTYVAATSSATTAITSPSVTVPSGDGVIVACRMNYSSGVSIAVSSSLAETWSSATNAFQSSGAYEQISYANFASGGSTTFTCTSSSASSYESMIVVLVTGTVGLDSGSVVSTTGIGTSVTTPSFSTSSAPEIGLLCAAPSAVSETFSFGTIAGQAPTLLATDTGSATSTVGCELALLPSVVTSQTGTFNWSTSQSYVGLFAGFTY